MESSYYREEVLNVALSDLLRDRGLKSIPETITKEAFTQNRKMPDVTVDFSGLRVMIECKVDDRINCHQEALDAARQRTEQGLAQIGIAVVYPSILRKAFNAKIALSESRIDFAVVTESQEKPVLARLPGLVGSMNQVQDHL